MNIRDLSETSTILQLNHMHKAGFFIRSFNFILIFLLVTILTLPISSWLSYVLIESVSIDLSRNWFISSKFKCPYYPFNSFSFLSLVICVYFFIFVSFDGGLWILFIWGRGIVDFIHGFFSIMYLFMFSSSLISEMSASIIDLRFFLFYNLYIYYYKFPSKHCFKIYPTDSDIVYF